MSNMPGLVYAQPYLPPIRPAVNPGRIGVSLWLDPEDPDLPTWQLTDGEDQGILLMRGVRGLGSPPHTAFQEEYAAADGAYHFGDRTGAREVFLPLYVFHDGDSEEWVERNDLLWRSFRRGRYSRLYARRADGQVRSLRIKYTSGGDEALELDSSFFGWAKYGIYFDATQPLWEGAPIVREWGVNEASVMYGVSSAALPFSIAYPNIAEAAIRNPGDFEASPRVTYEGPMNAGAEVTFGEDTIPVPFSIPAGEKLVIDHSPKTQTATLDGVDVTSDLGSFDFSNVDAGEEVSVGINIPGTSGKVKIELTPLYERVL